MVIDRQGPDHAAGNGSVMRCAPVAIRFHDHPELLRTVSINTSRITHAEPRCTWFCVAINQMIAYALRGGAIDAMVNAGIAGIEQPDVVTAIEAAPTLIHRDLNGSGFVLNAIQIAIWAVLTQPTFEDAVVSAIMVGDDTDTNAAVAGALAGAVHGYGAIPERWRKGVQQHDRLLNLADQLVAAASAE